MLAEHRVLTTTQIAALAFPNPRNTERRLAALWQWRCIERFRPHTRFGGGSAPWHWVLDDAGTAILAAAHGITVTELGYRRGTALAIAHSQRLAHTVGTNTLLADLARTGQLSDWWGERRCAAAWGDLARPDAAATWHTPTGHTGGSAAGARAVGFAVEYDTGTEPLTRVAAKLVDYADLAAAVGHTLPVLFWLPTVTRETALHHQLDATLLDTTHLDTTSPDTASVHAGAGAGAGPGRARKAGGGLLVATARGRPRRPGGWPRRAGVAPRRAAGRRERRSPQPGHPRPARRRLVRRADPAGRHRRCRLRLAGTVPAPTRPAPRRLRRHSPVGKLIGAAVAALIVPVLLLSAAAAGILADDDTTPTAALG